MALPKLTGKAKLKNDLEQLKVKVKRAQDDLNITINGKSLKEADKAAYNTANQAFIDAIAARDAAQIALDNYKEPVKPAKPKSAKEIEAQRQKDLIEGKVGQALEDQEQADATATIESIGADFDTKIKDARQYIFDLKEKGRKELAQTLKDAGYEVVVDGSFPNDTLLTNYVNSLKAAKTQNDLNKDVVGYEPVNWSNYISSRISAAGGGGGSATDVGINISSDTDAEALIQSTFKSTLGREATANELASFKKQLNKAEKAAGRKTTKSGNRTVYTSDLNREQFLTNEIKKIVDPKSGKSEFETKRAEKEGLTAQSLRAVAKLNGINLTQDQLDAYATDIRNGKDINVIKNGIRQMAGLGRPDSIKKLLAEGTDLDTIYSPYKTTMASLLEVPEDQIDLNDATLQSAIGLDKEMPLYEFRKALKKDNRWQYTNNARKEVSDNVLRVLKDFGFQG